MSLLFSRSRCTWAAALPLIVWLAGCATPPAPTPVIVPPTPPVVTPTPKPPPRLGLALGGGAARGFAHIGVIQVLEENGIRPSVVAGTSAGSVVAALYASGMNGAQLQKVAQTMEEASLADWTLPLFSRGVLKGAAIARFVNAQLGPRLIEDMKIPLGIVATDLGTGEGVLFRRGDLATAVRASSAVPAVFEPVKIAQREYVDGGLYSPVPVQFARQMGADVVLAIDISSEPDNQASGDVLQILLQTFTIMGKRIKTLELQSADLVVRPSLSGMNGADFDLRLKAIQAGRSAMQQALPKLRAMLGQKP